MLKGGKDKCQGHVDRGEWMGCGKGVPGGRGHVRKLLIFSSGNGMFSHFWSSRDCLCKHWGL